MAFPPSQDNNQQSSTSLFYELTPERILSAVEQLGIRCTGRSMALNSFENRVYEIELEQPLIGRDPPPFPIARAWENFCVAKFYRPRRWSVEQIQEEHDFLSELAAEEILVVPPIRDESGRSLFCCNDSQILFAVFPKVGGRTPQELDDEQLQRLGRMLARIHGVGARQPFRHRTPSNLMAFARDNVSALRASKHGPRETVAAICETMEQVLTHVESWFDGVPIHRIHGDCHYGNFLWASDLLLSVDFDDSFMGPAVQDIWLMTPGRDNEALVKRDILLEAYDQMRPFDHSTLRLVEPLRAMRMVLFAMWIGRRWEDPAFPRAFPQYDSPRYWQELLNDLREITSLIA